MRKRATSTEIDNRITILLRVLRRGNHSRTKIMQIYSKKWQVSERQIERYIKFIQPKKQETKMICPHCENRVSITIEG